MSGIMFRWVRDGKEVDDIEVLGYSVNDYFSENGLQDARDYLKDGEVEDALHALSDTYRGPDEDDIGLEWEIV